jgi:hypothetical protein
MLTRGGVTAWVGEHGWLTRGGGGVSDVGGRGVHTRGGVGAWVGECGWLTRGGGGVSDVGSRGVHGTLTGGDPD